MAEVRAMSRAGRENQILVALYLQYDRHRINGGTAYDIAKKIGMRATSPRFRVILNGMVESGKLIKSDSPKIAKKGKLKNGAKGACWYSVPMEDIDRKYSTSRRIEIKSRGVSVGQLKLL